MVASCPMDGFPHRDQGQTWKDCVSKLSPIIVCAQLPQICGFSVIAQGPEAGWRRMIRVAVGLDTVSLNNIGPFNCRAILNLRHDIVDVIAPLQIVHDGVFQPRSGCLASTTDEVCHDQPVGDRKKHSTREMYCKIIVLAHTMKIEDDNL
jgi:hypothetical protein